MARSSTAIFERVGHDVYCGEALYFGGQGWLGKRQRVWLTASIKIQEFPYGPGPFRPPPTPYGSPHTALDLGIRAELLHFVWADDVLALSEVCVAFHHTVKAARQAYIDLRWEQSLARIAQDMVTYDSEMAGLPSPSPWPSPVEAPGTYWLRDHQRRQQPSRSRSRSHRRSPDSPHSPRRLRDLSDNSSSPDVFTFCAEIL